MSAVLDKTSSEQTTNGVRPRLITVAEYDRMIEAGSVMDLTEEKGEKEKSYATWSSAECIKYILENDLI